MMNMFVPNNHKGDKRARLEFHLWSKSTSHHNHNMVTMIVKTMNALLEAFSMPWQEKLSFFFLTGGKKQKCFIEQRIRFLKNIYLINISEWGAVDGSSTLFLPWFSFTYIINLLDRNASTSQTKPFYVDYTERL